MLVSVTLNPSVDLAIFVDRLKLGDTNRVQRTERDAGGKGVNLSRVYAELGGETAATGFLGGLNGIFVREVLARQGVSEAFLEIEGETRINVSVEEEAGGPPTTLNDHGPKVSTDQIDALLDHTLGMVGPGSWVALGGSLPPGSPPDTFRRFAEALRAKGCLIALDADNEPMVLGIAARPDLVKPNDKEAARLLGIPTETDEESVAAARRIEAMLAPRGYALLSRGAKGAVLAHAGSAWVGRSPDIVPKSTIGSGDSMVAAFLWALGQGHGPAECLRWGLAAGAATAVTDGSEIGRRGTIETMRERCDVFSAS